MTWRNLKCRIFPSRDILSISLLKSGLSGKLFYICGHVTTFSGSKWQAAIDCGHYKMLAVNWQQQKWKTSHRRCLYFTSITDLLRKIELKVEWSSCIMIWFVGRLRLKCDGTRAETGFRLSAKRTSPFKSAGGVSSVDYWQPRCAHQR
jgi:hypothetical protein